jgi:hypothetical protein
MLMKTTGASYLRYRTWTRTPAKNLTPGVCAEFNAVKAAWDAISVPAQAGDPTCPATGGAVQVGTPAGCTSCTLSLWLHVDTSETTTTTQFDKRTVSVNGPTPATCSDPDRASGYQLCTINVGALAGQSVTIKLTGTEDVSLQPSFAIDDTALGAG